MRRRITASWSGVPRPRDRLRQFAKDARARNLAKVKAFDQLASDSGLLEEIQSALNDLTRKGYRIGQ
jgi:hypothetical protein